MTLITTIKQNKQGLHNWGRVGNKAKFVSSRFGASYGRSFRRSTCDAPSSPYTNTKDFKQVAVDCWCIMGKNTAKQKHLPFLHVGRCCKNIIS